MLAPLFVAAVTFLVFLPALENGFVNWDDKKNLLDNPNFRGLGWVQLKWMFTTLHMGPYQPLSWMTFALDYLLWGMNPTGYHLTNLLLHTLNAVIFYFLAFRLLGLTFPKLLEEGEKSLYISAAFAGLLFAVHPLRVESVAWATERRDVLSGLFYLLTILWYLKACEAPADRVTQRPWRAFSVGAYLLSLLSKGIGLGLPFILIVIDIYPLRRLPTNPTQWFSPPFRKNLLEKTPFFILALAAGIIGFIGQVQAGASHFFRSDLSMTQALFGTAFYLWKTLVPFNLLPLYERPFLMNSMDWPFVLSGIVVVIITLSLMMIRKRWPAGLAVWVCYILALAPVSGIVPFGPQIAADRYTYHSCLGFALLAGSGLVWGGRMGSPASRKALLLLAVFITSGLSYLTWQQVKIWHDTESLWRHTLAIKPNTSMAHRNLGVVLANQGRLTEAIDHYRQALTIRPNYIEVHVNLGNALDNQGKSNEAIKHYEHAIRADPNNPEAHFNFGHTLASQGRSVEAIGHYRQTLRIRPDFVEAHINLGVMLMAEGKLDQAIDHYNQALNLKPDAAIIHNNLGFALANQGKLEKAIHHYRSALRIDPNYKTARINLEDALKSF